MCDNEGDDMCVCVCVCGNGRVTSTPSLPPLYPLGHTWEKRKGEGEERWDGRARSDQQDVTIFSISIVNSSSSSR